MNDKYIFETESSREMELVSSRYKILSVLEELKNWRKELYKGYDYNAKILCDGKLYTYNEFKDVKDQLMKDESGLMKNYKWIYTYDDLIAKIDDLLYEVNYLINY